MISEGAITAPSAPTAELFRKSRRERVFLLFLVFMDCLLSALGFVFLLLPVLGPVSMKSWNVPHSDLKSFCVPFQVELLAGLVPSLDYERTSVVGKFTRQRFDRYRFAFARQQRKKLSV